jgi:hypothetical protein
MRETEQLARAGGEHGCSVSFFAWIGYQLTWIKKHPASTYNMGYAGGRTVSIPMRTLIVEDDRDTADYLQKGLAENGFIADVAHRLSSMSTRGMMLITRNSFTRYAASATCSTRSER